MFPKVVKIEKGINIFDEYFDGSPEKIIIEMTRPLARRILQLAAAVKKVKAYKICEFDYTPQFFNIGDDEELVEAEEFRTDGETLDVDDNAFYWSGSVKNTGINWETELISLDIPRELETVWKTPKSRLPLLVGTLKTQEARELLNERMKKL